MIVRRPSAGLAAWGLAALLLVAGCGAPEDQPPLDAEAEALTALLEGVEQADFRTAFGRLSEYDYTQYTRTEQFDGEDFMVAFREQVARIDNGEGGREVTVVESDSGGAFDFGFFKQFTSENIAALDVVDLVPYVLDDDPGYLRARNQEKYSYETVGDTLLWDRQARVVEVRARPMLGDGENIRRVRYYIDRGTNRLVAMYLERIDLALLFREESQFYVHMRPAASGELIPYNTRFHTLIRTPFRQDHQFRTVTTYYEAVPADG